MTKNANANATLYQNFVGVCTMNSVEIQHSCGMLFFMESIHYHFVYSMQSFNWKRNEKKMKGDKDEKSLWLILNYKV